MLILMDQPMHTDDSTTTFIVVAIIALIIGFIIGRLTKKSSSVAQEVAARSEELKVELNNERKAKEESLSDVESALDNVKNLAISMANTYQNLELAKARLTGKGEEAEKYLLQIRGGKLERIAYDESQFEDVEAEPTDNVADATTPAYNYDTETEKTPAETVTDAELAPEFTDENTVDTPVDTTTETDKETDKETK